MKDRKWIMLFVILAFAIIVGLAKRLRKLLIQEEGFTSYQLNGLSTVDYKYHNLYLFPISNSVYKSTDLDEYKKTGENWWDDKNHFLFDHLFTYFVNYIPHSFNQNEIINDKFLSKLYKISKLDDNFYNNKIAVFFTKIGNEPISVCFDVYDKKVVIRETLKLENTFTHVIEKSFHQDYNNNCKYDDSDEKDKKRIYCNPNSIPFYEILTWNCEYSTKHREMIGRIPDEIRYSYEPVIGDTSANFGFLRFDHMVEWLNFYNIRLYGNKEKNAIIKTPTNKCEKDRTTSSSQDAAENELLVDIYMFIESETNYDRFQNLLFDDNDTYNGILKNKHYNVLRELQFDNMIFVNKTFEEIVVKTIESEPEQKTVIDKKHFIPVLNNKSLYSKINDDTNLIEELIRTKMFLDTYTSTSIQRPKNKDIVTSAFLRYIGFWNIYHLLHPEHRFDTIDKSEIADKIDDKIKKVKKHYLPVILVLKDGYDILHVFKDDKYDENSEDRLNKLIEKLNETLLKSEYQENTFISHLRKLYDDDGKYLKDKEFNKIMNHRVFKQGTIRVKDVRLISPIVDYRMNMHKRVVSYLQTRVFAPLFEDANTPKLRALLNSMIDVLNVNQVTKKDNDLSLSECDQCTHDILQDMAERLDELEKMPDDDNIEMQVDKDNNKIETFKLNYRKYQVRLITSIMQIGFKVFLLELAHYLANNKSTNLVGDINSLSRTARSSYELKDSLDLGDFYY
jgi:hypothetical protein